MTHYRQRAASEKLRELRRHPPAVRYMLLAALCWQREREITDILVDLLLHIAHHIGARAEEKVEETLRTYVKKVMGKPALLYKLAKAAKGRPDGLVKEVIYLAVSEQTLDAVIQETEADAGYARQRGCKMPVFPRQETVPLDGVVKDEWQNLVIDETRGGRVNRISYEICLLTTLREKVRCKEIWVAGAARYRDPDEDVPQDFAARRDEYCDALQSLLTRPIDGAIIEQQYDELIKFASALRLGTADAEAILRRFTRSNVQHPTYKALCELGKALKTTFVCEYLRLESLRREIHEGLEVIETWNSANDFILYGKSGEFASNKTEDHEILMLSLHLLQISLVYVNTLMIQQVLAQPAWQGRLTARDPRALTPLKWQHINPYGTFLLDMQCRLRLDLVA